jgi:hypothetical protein
MFDGVTNVEPRERIVKNFGEKKTNSQNRTEYGNKKFKK